MKNRTGIQQGNLPPYGQVSVREELLQIAGDGIFYHGCDQRWFQKAWRRLSGCGPTTASSLFLYHQRANLGAPQVTKNACLLLMNELWGYITPTMRGVHTTEEYCTGALQFAEARGLEAETTRLDVPKKTGLRPSRDAVIRFLFGALKQDLPVAFLNHNNGAEKGLYSHHWVVIVSISHTPGGGAEVTFLDEGIIKRIDVANWLSTTKGGGGFATVRFS